MKIRKKPVEIEAVKWDKKFYEIPEWIDEAIDKPMPIGDDAPTGGIIRIGDDIHVSSLEGVVICKPGNYIMRGIKGELYVCEAEIFDLTYDIV